MALCSNYDVSPVCTKYDPGLACSPYLNSNANVYVQLKHKYQTPDEANDYNDSLNEVLTYLYLVLPNPVCREFLRLLLCNSIFPKCMPESSPSGIYLHKKQRLCKRVCPHLYNDVCDGLNNNFRNIITSFMQINFVQNANLVARQDIEEFLNTTCTESHFDEQQHSKEEGCFFEDVNRNETSNYCDGYGFDYNGALDVSENGNICNMWSSMCLKHAYINFKSISSSDRNYCRNPGGYRERPWCYVNNSTTQWEYCDVPKCPPTNGNYTGWSSWSACKADCNKNGFETRERNCTNPTPRYGGLNCSRYGPNQEKRSCFVTCSTSDSGVSTVLVAVVTSLSILMLIAVSIMLWIYCNKINTLPPDDERPLHDVLFIRDAVKYNEDDEVDEIFYAAYQSLKQFHDCFCFNCVRRWLLSLLDEHSKEENKIYVNKLMIKLKEKYYLEENKKIAADKIILENPYETNDTSLFAEEDKKNDEGCSNKCFFDHDIRRWLKEQIQASYDHLLKSPKDEEESQKIFLHDGLYFNYLPIYHKLSNIRTGRHT